MISVIFSISHGLLFFLTLYKSVRNTIITNVTCKHSFSPQKTFQLQGQRLMNESQGQRFCLFSAFSFIICLCVHVYRNCIESEFETAAVSGNREVFALMTAVGMSVFQNMGITNSLTISLHIVVFVVWIVYMSLLRFNVLAVLAICLLYCYFALLPALQVCVLSVSYLSP